MAAHDAVFFLHVMCNQMPLSVDYDFLYVFLYTGFKLGFIYIRFLHLMLITFYSSVFLIKPSF